MTHQWLGISASCMLRWQLNVQERRSELILASYEEKLSHIIFRLNLTSFYEADVANLADSTIYCFRTKKIWHLTS